MFFLASALAAEPTDLPKIKVSGMIFASWRLDPVSLDNAVSLDRAYLTAQATLTEHLATRLTLDADHMKPVELDDGSELTLDTKYRVFVKHAYVEGRWSAVRLRAGVIDTPYTPFYDNFVGIRYVTESFPKASKVLETADLGASVAGTHLDGRLDWTVAVLNGEGYGKLEVDAGKAAQARVTFDPLAAGGKMNLPITGFVSVSGQPTVGTPVVTWIAAAGFKHPYVVAWAEYLGVSQGETAGGGWSGTANPRLPKVGGLIFRYDHFDPDLKTEDDASDTLVAGVSHDFFEKVSLAATYEQLIAEATPESPDRSVVLHLQAGF